jgi:hypothetical protein
VKIIIRLLGGIGNQLFQYAVGRSLAIRHDGELLLDDSLLKRRRFCVTPRSYELGVYNIRARKLHSDEESNLQFLVRRPFQYLYATGLMKSNYTYYREPHFEFDSRLHQLTGDLIIEGYWQSERYFIDIANELRRELQPINLLDVNAQKYFEQIQRENSVSLHVRRGDYISNPAAAKNHVVCDIAYYQRAVAAIVERVANPVFFVFTDDPVWVAKKLRIDFPMVLVSRPLAWPAHDDLRLMSHCAHHIIANSSFSWWGAWLNSCPGKIVVAPSRWFKVEPNIQDLIPRDWNLV